MQPYPVQFDKAFSFWAAGLDCKPELTDTPPLAPDIWVHVSIAVRVRAGPLQASWPPAGFLQASIFFWTSEMETAQVDLTNT